MAFVLESLLHGRSLANALVENISKTPWVFTPQGFDVKEFSPQKPTSSKRRAQVPSNQDSKTEVITIHRQESKETHRPQTKDLEYPPTKKQNTGNTLVGGSKRKLSRERHRFVFWSLFFPFLTQNIPKLWVSLVF